eukprot:CAMPEP_0180088486 /NCGR_PEP_ID=MMETSP0985-20121206/22284_1 /TAXON_ID=483367 /ORGANISM="non described non described, Strain CCMP 2436" /LENGTH=110 /DNA_ID=CAMNT_0022022945 /DNA_START=156 /DNA_END=485 /DNA_ORIENTATION=-
MPNPLALAASKCNARHAVDDDAVRTRVAILLGGARAARGRMPLLFRLVSLCLFRSLLLVVELHAAEQPVRASSQHRRAALRVLPKAMSKTVASLSLCWRGVWAAIVRTGL